MWHAIFIAVHAVTGGIALLAGCVAIGCRALFGTYLWSLVAMEVFLMLAIAAEWAVIDVAARVLFAAFALLGLAGHFALRAVRERLTGSTSDHRGVSLTG